MMCTGVGCARSHCGYTEEQSHQLSAAPQAAAKAEYQQAIDAKNQATRPDPIAEDRERLIRRALGMDPEHAPY
ncbi:MAG: hypothetical protein AMJ69_09025 [Gammaproteobacteria bacterium SG8_47]|nr:MAG: hypothetical protein AMJ69_09025 [Gammaproteobacteria bacterium SG8_47]